MRALIALALLLGGCATVRPAAAPTITDAEMRATVAVLASDAFEGRMAGTTGERKTIEYITDRFRSAGLTSGGRGPSPYLDPFTIKAAAPKPPPKDAKLPGGQRTFMEAMSAAGTFTSHNVVGVARGKRPDGKVVVVMAHWDHLGICRPAGEVDRICNGAVDNASGVAAMIAVADRVARMGLDRDVWFVATGGEEWGLLGAKAWADKPPVKLFSIVAGFNLDTIAIAPKGAPVAIVATDNSPLQPLAKQAAATLGRAWDGDNEAKGFIERQDGWALAQHKVPMIMAGGSFSDLKLLMRFLAADYHGSDDELTPSLDLGGAVDDANLHVELVRLAASRAYNPRIH
jgi:hypothetical protein